MKLSSRAFVEIPKWLSLLLSFAPTLLCLHANASGQPVRAFSPFTKANETILRVAPDSATLPVLLGTRSAPLRPQVTKALSSIPVIREIQQNLITGMTGIIVAKKDFTQFTRAMDSLANALDDSTLREYEVFPPVTDMLRSVIAPDDAQARKAVAKMRLQEATRALLNVAGDSTPVLMTLYCGDTTRIAEYKSWIAYYGSGSSARVRFDSLTHLLWFWALPEIGREAIKLFGDNAEVHGLGLFGAEGERADLQNTSALLLAEQYPQTLAPKDLARVLLYEECNVTYDRAMSVTSALLDGAKSAVLDLRFAPGKPTRRDLRIEFYAEKVSIPSTGSALTTAFRNAIDSRKSYFGDPADFARRVNDRRTILKELSSTLLPDNIEALKTYGLDDDIHVLIRNESAERADSLRIAIASNGSCTYFYYSEHLRQVEMAIQPGVLLSSRLHKVWVMPKAFQLSKHDVPLAIGNSIQYVFGGLKGTLSQKSWASQTGLEGQGMSILVVEAGGFSITHPDYADRIIWHDTLPDGTSPIYDNHGTACVGEAAGSGKLSDYELTGVAPKAQLLLEGYAYWSSASDAAANAGAISASVSIAEGVGTPDPSQFCSDIKTEFYDRGIQLVGAIGDSGPGFRTIDYPGGCPESIGVGDCFPIDKMVDDISSRGPSKYYKYLIKPDVLAPGDQICSTDYTANSNSCAANGSPYYGVLGETSAAAPFVAGVVALVKQHNPSLSLDQIKSSIVNYADNIPGMVSVFDQGGGEVNALRAINAPVYFSPVSLSITDDIAEEGSGTVTLQNGGQQGVIVHARYDPANYYDATVFNPLILFSDQDFDIPAGASKVLTITVDASKLHQLNSTTVPYSERIVFDIYPDNDYPKIDPSARIIDSATLPMAFAKVGNADPAKNIHIKLAAPDSLLSEYPGYSVASSSLYGKVFSGQDSSVKGTFSSLDTTLSMTQWGSTYFYVVAVGRVILVKGGDTILVQSFCKYPVDFNETANFPVVVDPSIGTDSGNVLDLHSFVSNGLLRPLKVQIHTEGALNEDIVFSGISMVQSLELGGVASLLQSECLVDATGSNARLIAGQRTRPPVGWSRYVQRQPIVIVPKPVVLDAAKNALWQSPSVVSYVLRPVVNGYNFPTVTDTFSGTKTLYTDADTSYQSNQGAVADTSDLVFHGAVLRAASGAYSITELTDPGLVGDTLHFFKGFIPAIYRGKMGAPTDTSSKLALDSSAALTLSLSSNSGAIEGCYVAGPGQIDIAQPDGTHATGSPFVALLDFARPNESNISGFVSEKGSYWIDYQTDSLLADPLCLKAQVLWQDTLPIIIQQCNGLESTGCCALSSVLNGSVNHPQMSFTVFPNPASASSMLQYFLTGESSVSITIYDALGRIVARPVVGEMESGGPHEVSFETKDLPPGLYSCRLSAGGGETVARVVVVR